MPQRSNSPSSGKRSAPRPEMSFGPYPGGISVAVWLNEVQGDQGARKIRSVTISPRRYLDPKSNEWKDSGSYRPGDLPVLIFGLQKALEFVFTQPMPGQETSQSPEEEQPHGEVPF